MMRTRAGWMAMAVVLAMLAGCSESSTPTAAQPQTQTLTLGLNWVPEPQFGGFYAAAEGGAFDRHGVHIKLRPGGAGAPTVQEVAFGRIEYGIAAGDQVVMARAEGMDIVALFAVYQTSPRAVMVHKARGFTSLADVFKSDITLAMEPGRNFSDFLKDRYGMGRVNLVPYTGGMERFIKEPNFGMQCFATSEPLEARRRGADPQVFPVADAGYNPYVTVLICSGARLRENATQVGRVVAAVREGWRAYLDDPAPANAVMATLNTTMDAQTFVDSAQVQKPFVVGDAGVELGSMTRERWQTLIDQLTALKVLDPAKAPKAEDCYFNPPAPSP